LPMRGACARARRTVSEFACLFGSPPGMVAPRFEPGDVQDGGQGKEGFSAGDGAKDAGFGLSFWETNSIEGEAGGTKQGEQEADNGGEDARAFLPTRAGIERVLLVVEHLRRHDGEKSTAAPSGNGRARDVNVLGNGQRNPENARFEDLPGVLARSTRDRAGRLA